MRPRFPVVLVASSALALATSAAFAGCSVEPRIDLEANAPRRDAGAPEATGPTCGDTEDELPEGVAVDPGSHTVASTCDGEATGLLLTVLDDGLVRLRYGSNVVADGARGSLVPVERPAATKALRVGRRGAAAVVCTEALEIAITPRTCALSAKDVATGAIVLDDAAAGYFRDADGVGVVHTSPPGERFYGLGLHTATQATGARSGLDLRGSVIELYNTDAFDAAAGGFRADSKSLYETIPFYAGLRGKTAYGVFTDNTHRQTFDLAASDPGRVRVHARGGAIDQYLVAGPSLREVLRRYTRLTGLPPMPAPWALGFHQSRWEGPCEGNPAERPFCSAPQITALARLLRDRGVPADGLFLDIQHMNGFRSFTFDATRFSDPEAFLGELGALGFHVSTIVDPGIKVDPAWDVYQAAVSGDHLLKAPGATTPFQGEVWPGPAMFPDFSAAKTRSWWSGLAGGLVRRGVAGLWIDMNEPASFTSGTVPDSLAADGDGRATTMAEVHNAYGYLEAKATFEGMQAARASERPFVLSRAAFAGQQKWSAVWTGDAPSTWTTLGMTMPQLLHLGMSGIPFAGSDVGGYSGREESTPELFSRWMAMGAISPFFRAHAEKDARRQEPWSFGDETFEATRALVRQRYALMPYLYSLFDEASRTGAPVLRPLVFEFQDDESTHAVADEAMLGPWLLAAPILDAKATRAVLLPKGRWYELHSGAAYEGGRTITLAATPDPLPKDALPLFAREGAIVVRTEVGTNVASARGAALYLDAFPGPAKSAFTLREDDGTTAAALARVTFSTVRTATGAHFEASPQEGTYVAPHRELVLRLRRVDHDPSAVTLDGQVLVRAPSVESLTLGSFFWDKNDRAVVVSLPRKFPFALDVAFNPELDADGDVDVPIRVALPAGTPVTTAIHVASSRAGWVHAPLVRVGDEATGTLRVPRGGYTSFKITRGDWPTVEKSGTCAEIVNRRALGAAEGIRVTVAAWADRCP